MAKKIKVNAEFSTTGAGKVAKDTEKVTKAQTRLGQTSASAGRQFSSQAQGLGGLVSAYAGAAATIFAVTQAFDALNRAARAEQTITGVNALANAIGESGPKILQGIQEITKGQLSLVQSAELANLALSSGFSGKQIENLAGIALKASRALGRDLTDSFNRLVRGVAKLEPELLDELGIFVRIEPAAEAYAASIGKVASQLSNFEKRQAFANAVAEEGTDKFKNIDTDAATSAESLEKFAATLSDLGTKVGAFIAGALQPLVEALSGPVTAIGAFGILAKTVFGTAIREARVSLENFSQKAVESGNNVQDFLGGGSAKAAQANATLATELDKVNLSIAKGTTDQRKRINALIKEGRVNELTTSQLKKFQTELEKEKLTAAVRRQIIALTRANREYRKAQAAVNARLGEFNVVAKKAGAAAAFLGKTIGKAGKAALGIVGAIITFITYASLIVTVGAQIAEAFGWMDTIANGVKSVVLAFQQLLGITRELREEAKILDQTRLAGGFDREERVDVGTMITNARGVFTQGTATELGKNLNKLIKEGTSQGLKGTDLEKFIEKELSAPYVQVLLSDEFKDKLRQIGKTASEQFGVGFTEGIGAFAEATGRELSTVLRQVDRSKSGLTFKGVRGKDRDVQFERISGLNLGVEETEDRRERNAARAEGLQIQELEVALQDKLNSGNATAESIEKSLGALQNKKTALLAEEEKLVLRIRSGDLTGRQVQQAFALLDIIQQNLAEQEKSEQLTNKQASLQLTILNARRQILKTFGAQIKASEKIADSFIIENDSVRLVQEANDKRKAQSAFLKQSLDLGLKLLRQERAGAKLRDNQAQLAALARDAQNAIIGNFEKSVSEARKLTQELEKQARTLKAQGDTLDLQINLQEKLNAITEAKTELAIRKTNLDVTKQTLEAEIKLAKVKADAAKIDRDASSQRAQDIMAEFGDLISPQKRRGIELRIAQRDLAALKTTIDQQKVNAEKLAQIETDKVIAQNAFLAAQIGGGANATPGLIREREAAQKKLEDQRIEAAKNERVAQISLLQKRNEGIIKELKGFKEHVDGIAAVLAADIVERKKLALTEKEGEFERQAVALAAGDSSLTAQIKDFDPAKITADQARQIFFNKQLGETSVQVGNEIDDLVRKLEGNAGAFEDLKKQAEDNATAQKKLADLKRGGATDAEIAKAQAELAAGQQELQNIQTKLKGTIGDLNNEYNKQSKSVTNLAKKTADANNTYLQVAKEIATNVGERFANSLRDLNQAMIDGTLTSENFKQGVKDLFVGILQDVQKTVFEKTIVEPAKAFVEDAVLGLFGIQPDKKIEDALTTSAGGTAVRVVMAGGSGAVPMPAAVKQLGIQGAGSGDPVKDIMAANQAMVGIESSQLGGSFQTMDDTLDDVEGALGLTSETAQTAALSFQGLDSNLQQTNGIFPTFMNAIKGAGSAALDFALDLGKSLLGLFGGGGGGGSSIIDPLLSAGKSVFGSIFGGGGSAVTGGFAGSQAGLFTPGLGATPFAIGGLVQKMAAGGMMRDRVPAMLEPGEFVMQRKAVNRIGADNLSAMNGSGGMPNIEVQVNNEGTPKDAQANVKPQMDINKMVVEIVTRDIRNNGSIRKTLRTGTE